MPTQLFIGATFRVSIIPSRRSAPPPTGRSCPQRVAGDGTPLAFLLCLAVRREWGDLRLPSAVNWPSPPRSRAVTVEPPSDWPLYPAAFAAALSERRGGEAIQCAAEVRLPRRRMRALPAHCSFRPRDFATTRCSLSLAALDLWRAAIGTHDPFRMRPSPYSHS